MPRKEPAATAAASPAAGQGSLPPRALGRATTGRPRVLRGRRREPDDGRGHERGKEHDRRLMEKWRCPRENVWGSENSSIHTCVSVHLVSTSTHLSLDSLTVGRIQRRIMLVSALLTVVSIALVPPRSTCLGRRAVTAAAGVTAATSVVRPLPALPLACRFLALAQSPTACAAGKRILRKCMSATLSTCRASSCHRDAPLLPRMWPSSSSEVAGPTARRRP